MHLSRYHSQICFSTFSNNHCDLVIESLNDSNYDCDSSYACVSVASANNFLGIENINSNQTKHDLYNKMRDSYLQMYANYHYVKLVSKSTCDEIFNDINELILQNNQNNAANLSDCASTYVLSEQYEAETFDRSN